MKHIQDNELDSASVRVLTLQNGHSFVELQFVGSDTMLYTDEQLGELISALAEARIERQERHERLELGRRV